MNTWYLQDCYQDIINTERKILATALTKLYGYYLLQLGGSDREDFLPENSFSNKIFLTPENMLRSNNDGKTNYVAAQYEELPFLPESIDAALVLHVLEFSHNPRAIIKEIYQTLIFGGHILIFGFNPVSILGLKKIFTSKKNAESGIFTGRFINQLRVHEWLVQAGFSDIKMQHFNFGKCYMFTAYKKAFSVTPLRNKIFKFLPIRNFAVKPTPATNSNCKPRLKPATTDMLTNFF